MGLILLQQSYSTTKMGTNLAYSVQWYKKIQALENKHSTIYIGTVAGKYCG